MLVAKPEKRAESIGELMVRIRAILKQFPDVNPGHYLIRDHDPNTRPMVLLVVYVVMLVAFVGMVITGGMKLPIAALICAAVAGVSWLYSKHHEKVDRRMCRADNRKLHVRYGALVMANSDLFNQENDEPRWCVMLVTADRRHELEPGPLHHFASKLFEMKTGDIETPDDLKELVEKLRDEGVEHPAPLRQVPERYSLGPDVFMTDVFIEPGGTPYGYVDRRSWPLMFHEEDRDIPMQPIPHLLWWEPKHDYAFGFDTEDEEEADE
jgi:hypothetical protein